MAKRLGARHFNGKLYPYWQVVAKKSQANELKRQLKKKGYKVRIVRGTTKGKRVYVVYSRKG